MSSVHLPTGSDINMTKASVETAGFKNENAGDKIAIVVSTPT